MESGLGAKDPKRCPIPLELALSQHREGRLSRLFLRSVHLPRQIGEIQGGENLRFGGFQVV